MIYLQIINIQLVYMMHLQLMTTTTAIFIIVPYAQTVNTYMPYL